MRLEERCEVETVWRNAGDRHQSRGPQALARLAEGAAERIHLAVLAVQRSRLRGSVLRRRPAWRSAGKDDLILGVVVDDQELAVLPDELAEIIVGKIFAPVDTAMKRSRFLRSASCERRKRLGIARVDGLRRNRRGPPPAPGDQGAGEDRSGAPRRRVPISTICACRRS